jgi:hypothetical protein
MRPSGDEGVQTMLTEYRESDPEKFHMIVEMRRLVFDRYPDVGERIMYGGIMFSLDKKDFGGIFPYGEHISFEFGEGHAMDDPDGTLEGGGKYRRHLKIRTLADIDDKRLDFFLSQVK